MFYKRGEVISDQFDHLKVIGFGSWSANSGKKSVPEPLEKNRTNVLNATNHSVELQN